MLKNKYIIIYYIIEDVDVKIEIHVQSPDYVPELKTKTYLPWSLIAEPARDQIITISNFTVDGTIIDVSTSDYEVEWVIDGRIYNGK